MNWLKCLSAISGDTIRHGLASESMKRMWLLMAESAG